MTWTNAFDIGPCEILLVHWVEGNPVVIPPSEWAANGVSITNNAGILTTTRLARVGAPGPSPESDHVR